LTTSRYGAYIRAVSTTGLDLRLQRVARRVKVIDLAKRMKVQHPRVSQIEAMAVVTDAAAERYLSALATFPVVTGNREEAA
jgi:SOS-response transcriptional repressor LexA